ncbi:MAG: TraR/DksA family transcriptional regulator [gamma proteobacterium symbiont of Lucinoma myriamae]|nr:TraR/DksA family transcriptional regulator [gamma proteobacterium symbiont of Lucinoma myriamae]MCU7833506.1 TraR/DksA family transcriptional regulator [gamma proteobacterium symbiont of Lucinoma myriamae]
MDKKNLQQIRQLLFNIKSDLQDQEKTFKEVGKPVELDQSKVGRISRMDAMQAQQMALDSSRRRQQQLAKIDSALHRIESGDYGYCLRCDEDIDIRRLLIDPTSIHCIECAEKISS